MTDASLAPQAADGLIKDTTTQGFRQDVLAESMRQPVLVDFWAPWCGPCRQLTPLLEKVVKAAKGKVKLVKLNIDEHPQIPGQLGVQSIPAVFAFDRGQPVDGFVGALPESQLKQFIERLVGPGGAGLEDVLAEAGARLEAGDAVGAAEIYAAILAEEPEHAGALAGLVRAQIAAGNLEAARRILDSIPAARQTDAAVTGARAALELAEATESLGSTADLSARLERSPDDHQARFDLALALNAAGRRSEAADALIEIIRRERSWNEDAARKQLLQFFDAWGPTDEATRSGRRRFSAVWFA